MLTSIAITSEFYPSFLSDNGRNNDTLGVGLSQIKSGEERPIAFASRILTKAERNYSTVEKELLEIEWEAKNFRTYLLARPFKVYTDYKPLKDVFNVKDRTTRSVGFHHKLSEYDYGIEYKRGSLNANVDALSRTPHPESKKHTHFPY